MSPAAMAWGTRPHQQVHSGYMGSTRWAGGPGDRPFTQDLSGASRARHAMAPQVQEGSKELQGVLRTKPHCHCPLTQAPFHSQSPTEQPWGLPGGSGRPKNSPTISSWTTHGPG